MENVILDNSSASFIRILVFSSSRYSESFNKLNQYLVYKLSLYAIEIFAEKSAGEIAPLASGILAPNEVPDRNNCFDNTNSFLEEISIL